MRRAPTSHAKRRQRRSRRPPAVPAPPPGGLAKAVIVGRPNVGKSTLFNALVGIRRAIVSATPGTTRDRLNAVVSAWRPGRGDVAFELVDTGGLGLVDDEAIAAEVTSQIQTAIAEADALIFLLDARDGLTPLDGQIADVLRRAAAPVIVVANKCETEDLEIDSANFMQLGLGEPVPVSAESRKNLEDLRRRIALALPEAAGPAAEAGRPGGEPGDEAGDGTAEEPADEPPRVAIVGRRNAGKSTFVNSLVGQARVVVSSIPGTTRDPIDVRAEAGGAELVIVDTAGVGRRREGRSAPDHFSIAASRRTVERAEAVLMLLDADGSIGTVERELARVVGDACRPCVIVVNKWDLAEKKGVQPDEFTRYLTNRLRVLAHAPIVYASALRGERVADAARIAADLALAARRKHPTSTLNRMLQRALKERHPSSPRGEFPKVYYATQTGVSPPAVTIFVNDPDRFKPSYVRFLESRFREYWDQGAEGGGEVPVRVALRTRPRS